MPRDGLAPLKNVILRFFAQNGRKGRQTRLQGIYPLFGHPFPDDIVFRTPSAPPVPRCPPVGAMQAHNSSVMPRIMQKVFVIRWITCYTPQCNPIDYRPPGAGETHTASNGRGGTYRESPTDAPTPRKPPYRHGGTPQRTVKTAYPNNGRGIQDAMKAGHDCPARPSGQRTEARKARAVVGIRLFLTLSLSFKAESFPPP